MRVVRCAQARSGHRRQRTLSRLATKPSSVCRLNTLADKTAWTRCTSTSWTDGSTQWRIRRWRSPPWEPQQSQIRRKYLAGRQGFEPRLDGPEPPVLPLNDLPAWRNFRLYRSLGLVDNRRSAAALRDGTTRSSAETSAAPRSGRGPDALGPRSPGSGAARAPRPGAGRQEWAVRRRVTAAARPRRERRPNWD